jgi:hypothetical protein
MVASGLVWGVAFGGVKLFDQVAEERQSRIDRFIDAGSPGEGIVNQAAKHRPGGIAGGRCASEHFAEMPPRALEFGGRSHAFQRVRSCSAADRKKAAAMM